MLERAVGGLDDHDAGVEEVDVVSGGRHLREVEEEVEVAEYDDVGVDEDDLVVVGELPEAELAVVVLVVGASLGFRVSDPGYEPELPARGSEILAFGSGDGVVEEEDKVALCAGLEEALGQRYGSADVGALCVEDGDVGFFGCILCGPLDLGQIIHFIDSCNHGILRKLISILTAANF